MWLTIVAHSKDNVLLFKCEINAQTKEKVHVVNFDFFLNATLLINYKYSWNSFQKRIAIKW